MYYNHPLLRAPTEHLHHPKQSHHTTIKVAGEGILKAEPDIAQITIGVITENKNLSEAQKDNATKSAKLITVLQNQGIASKDIQTVSYHIDMQYDYVEGKQIFRGYRVTHLLQVTIRDIRKVGEIVDAAVESGANQVSNIQFTLEDPGPLYNKALSLALKNCQQKAKTIATNLGLKWSSVPVKVLETTQVHMPPVPYQATFALKSEATTPIQPGELDVKADINAEFILYH